MTWYEAHYEFGPDDTPAQPTVRHVVERAAADRLAPEAVGGRLDSAGFLAAVNKLEAEKFDLHRECTEALEQLREARAEAAQWKILFDEQVGNIPAGSVPADENTPARPLYATESQDHGSRTFQDSPTRENGAEQAAEVEQLRYERHLLGAARMTMDLIAAGTPDRWDSLRAEAERVAQAIVDEIGHSVTDEPALGPTLREELAEARAQVDRLLKVVGAKYGEIERLQLLLDHAEQYARDLQDSGVLTDEARERGLREATEGRGPQPDIAAAVERLALAAMNLRSARRRITGEYTAPERRLDPLPPLEGAAEEIERARTILAGPWEPADQPEPAAAVDAERVIAAYGFEPPALGTGADIGDITVTFVDPADEREQDEDEDGTR